MEIILNQPLTSVTTDKPFLRWPGNKQRLTSSILPLIPPDTTRLIEPFAGSAALSAAFAQLNPQPLVLNDVLPDLMNVYRALKDGCEAFVASVRPLFSAETNTAATYYTLRNEFNNSRCADRRAQLFLYLNRHGFNGLVRFNQRGQWNVPFGDIAVPKLPEGAIVKYALWLQRTTLCVGDFRDQLLGAGKGDFVLCDPRLNC